MFARCCSVSIKSNTLIQQMLVSEEQTLIEFFWHPLAFHLLCSQGPGTWPTYLAKVLEKGAKSQSAGGEKPASDILPGSSWFVCSDWWVLVSFPWLLTSIDHTYSLRVDSSCGICGHSVGFLYSKEAAWLTWQIAARRTLRKREPKGEDMTFLCRPVQHFKVLACTL